MIKWNIDHVLYQNIQATLEVHVTFLRKPDPLSLELINWVFLLVLFSLIVQESNLAELVKPSFF